MFCHTHVMHAMSSWANTQQFIYYYFSLLFIDMLVIRCVVWEYVWLNYQLHSKCIIICFVFIDVVCFTPFLFKWWCKLVRQCVFTSFTPLLYYTQHAIQYDMWQQIRVHTIIQVVCCWVQTEKWKKKHKTNNFNNRKKCKDKFKTYKSRLLQASQSSSCDCLQHYGMYNTC